MLFFKNEYSENEKELKILNVTKIKNLLKVQAEMGEKTKSYI